ncbi:MAG TPA: DUF2723 domain-containing protein [Phycisphaerales bacterium]|nr:DUF2723 domain-containing protein [Phycisphaerales bacterium]
MTYSDISVVTTNRKHGRWYLFVLGSAIVFYFVSCAPGALWQDSGMFQYRIWQNDLEGGLGLALSHPLYCIIGIVFKSIPLGEFGFRINLISAICGAFTVANVFLLLRLLVDKLMPALLGAVTLAVSWTFWQHSVIAEVYTLYTAFFTAEMIFLLLYIRTGRQRYIYLLALFNGISIANHMLGIIPLVCYFVFTIFLLVKRRINFKVVIIMSALWILGALPYEYLIVKQFIATGDSLATVRSALFGNGWSSKVLNAAISLRVVIEDIFFIGYNFPTPNIILFIPGVFALCKLSSLRIFVNILLSVTILFFIFAFRYTVPDRYAFFIPFYCLVSIIIGVGLDSLLALYNNKLVTVVVFILALLPIGVYAVVPVIAERMQVNIGTKRQIPYRNDYTYFLRPWQRYNYGPELFAGEALSSVENEAVIIADGTTVYALWYLQEVKGKNAGVKVLSKHGDYKNPIEFPTEETIGRLMAERAVYVVSPVAGYCPKFLLERYDFTKAGILYKTVEKK